MKKYAITIESQSAEADLRELAAEFSALAHKVPVKTLALKLKKMRREYRMFGKAAEPIFEPIIEKAAELPVTEPEPVQPDAGGSQEQGEGTGEGSETVTV